MKNNYFSLFIKYNLIFTIILFLPFLIYNSNYTFTSFLLVSFGLISTASLIVFLIYLIFYLFAYKNKIVLYLVGLIFVLIDIGIVIDFFIFKIYKFHINAMVLNIILSPKALESLQFGTMPIVVLSLSILALFIFELILIKKIISFDKYDIEDKNIDFNKKFLAPLIFIFLIEKVSYGFADLTNKTEIISKFGSIPAYQPLTFNKLAYKYFDYKKDVNTQNTIIKNAKLKYPINPIEIDNPNKINIFIFAFDAVQNLYINKTIAPNISKLKLDSIVLNNHFSGGNATRFGIFSLMYGINSTYWFSFLEAKKGAILFDVLKKLNYNINIISSTNTSWPEFRKTCYVNVLDSIKDNHKGLPWELDKQSTKEFLDVINKYNKKDPIFSFVFLDAPHGYSYPNNFNKFNAKGNNINYLKATKNSQEIQYAKARYKNAIYYDDYLLGKMINKLKQKGLYNNSLIIFTSDHGQEFYEYGYFGHNSAFDKAQTNTPMIIKLPNNLKTKLKIHNTNQLTSHIDIVPTILHILGVKNPSSDYSNGYNIFDINYHRNFIYCANWSENAIITPKYTYLFSNMPNKMFHNIVRNTYNYKIIPNAKIDNNLVLKVINQNRKFLK